MFISVDRDYSKCQSLITWVVKCSGTLFGTMKRTLWAPFTFDQKKYFSSDARVPLFDHKITHLVDKNKPFAYFNGFGGATMLQSTDFSHRFHVWDRIKLDTVETRLIETDMTSTYFRKIEGFPSTENDFDFLTTVFANSVKFITTHQNIHEWFVMRMFCLTASTSCHSINFSMKNDEFNKLPHWEHLRKYYSKGICDNYPSIDHEYENEANWALSMVEKEDNWEWLKIEDNIKSFQPSQLEYLREAIREICSKTLSKRIHIHHFFILSEGHRHLFGFLL